MQEPHTHRDFDVELARIGRELEAMGEAAAGQLEAALSALERRDDAASEQVIAADAAIDECESHIGHDVMRLVALRQPVARDLREVLAALRIASCIERVGDLAANIAKRSRVLNSLPVVSTSASLRPLAELAKQQLRDVLRAYVLRDSELAIEVRERDVELDRLHTALFRDLLDWMTQNNQHVGVGAHLLFMAKNIERIGDHATNIAENVWFIEHGETPLQAREKRDASSSLGD